MNTLLIHQPYRFDIHPACLPTIVPRNLLMLGACLRAKGHSTRLHDMQIDHLGPASIAGALDAHRPQLVGLSLHAAPFIPATKICCEAVKARRPDVPLVVGGVFTSTYRERIFEVIPEIDVIVLNEGEETIVELADALASGRPLQVVPGIIFKDENGKAVATSPRGIIEDLNTLPMPAYDLLDLARYRQPGLLPPYTEAQRGCPYACKFCGVHFPNRTQAVRFRDPKAIADEVQLLHERYGFGRFFFSDDTFTFNHQFVRQICRELVARGLHQATRWTAYTRADRINSELAETMAYAGCACLALGVETGANRGTASIEKRESVQDYARGVEIIKKAGMDVHTLIIFGFPEVTHDDIPMAAKFLLEAKPTMSQFFIFHPVPGTEFFERPEKHGMHFRFEKLEDWYKNDFIEEPLCDSKHLSKEEIIKYFISYNLAFNSYESAGERPALQQRLVRNALPRKAKDVVVMRTGDMALYTSPYLPPGLQYADLHKNARQLDETQYEVLLRCNGDFTIEEITERVGKLFDFEPSDALVYVVNALRRFEQLKLIEPLPALAEYQGLWRGD